MTKEVLVLSHAQLGALVESGRWLDILAITESIEESKTAEPGYFFFRGMALTKLARPADGIPLIEHGLSLNPNSAWGNKLLFDALRSNNQLDEAFKHYSTFIESPHGRESDKAWYVQWASELGMFDLAADMNEQRTVIRDVPRTPRFALAVQCFCKADTLEEVFESFLRLENAGGIALVILQDSNIGSMKPDRYEAGYMAVKDVISKWLPLLLSKFYSVERLENAQNLGTAPTCRRLLDHVSNKYDGFLFIEDDCLLAPPALQWIVHHLDTTLSDDGLWFVTCESSNFDKEDRHIREDLRVRLEAIAHEPSLQNAYVLLDFVPSTCFGTTSSIWNRCAKLRSFTRGPESLNRFMLSKGLKTVAPVVPYASDIGMLHSLGYSMTSGGLENVRERKGTYVWAKGPFESSLCAPYPGDRSILFGATSKLEEEQIARIERSLLTTVF